MTASRTGGNVNIAGVAGEWLTPVIQTYNGSTDLPVNAGVYAAVVRYDGSANYEAITRTYTLTILKAVPYLPWGIPRASFYGTPLGPAQLNATGNVAGVHLHAAAGTVLNAGSHTLAATFTPADAANYTSPSISAVDYRVEGERAARLVTGRRTSSMARALSATQLNATASVAGHVRLLAGGRNRARCRPSTCCR